MLKLSLFLLLSNLFFFISCQTTSTQSNLKENKPNLNQSNDENLKSKESEIVYSEVDESQRYELDRLKSDYNQVDVVAYVDVKSLEIADYVGDKEENIGYNLYRLKAHVKEVFKGKIETKVLEFYTSAEMQYPQEYLTGEKIVFLDWSDNSPDNKMSLFTLENSTLSIKYNVVEKMRKIAKKNR